MKKIGKLTEARLVIPEEPKMYPLVSDKNFKGKVFLENARRGYKGIKGGTAAAKKEAERRTKLKKRKGGDLDEDGLGMNQRGRITQPGAAPKVDPGTYQVYNSMTDAKDPNWIQGAEKDIKRRGTEGKCTPITKPGCTGKAKALAKTFKKMAKKRDAEIVSKKEKAAMKKENAGQGFTTNSKGEKVFHPKSEEFKKLKANIDKKAQAYKDSLGPIGGDK